MWNYRQHFNLHTLWHNLFSCTCIWRCAFILWWQNLNWKFLLWQTTVTTKETVQVTTLELKENDLSEEEDIQYGESVVLYIWLEICIHFRVCLLEDNLKIISSIFYWFLFWIIKLCAMVFTRVYQCTYTCILMYHYEIQLLEYCNKQNRKDFSLMALHIASDFVFTL